MNVSDKKNVLNRRIFLVTGVAAVSGLAGWSAFPSLGLAGMVLTPPQAHKKALNGEVLLVDIRRPDEWAKTGSGQGASRLDMRRSDFIDALNDLVQGDRTRPVALICARGVRSRRMGQRLLDAGFVNIIDIPEGMLGSRAGPGWLERGLPVIR
jgi:rhodanese-related sulfurtransferase